MQYVPIEGVYTYFRYDSSQTVMVVMNTDKNEKMIQPERFVERIKGFTSARNIVNHSMHTLSSPWKIPGKSIWVLELGK